MNSNTECSLTLDLSKNSLKKIPKHENAQDYRVLILDENLLEKLDNMESYPQLEKISISKNKLSRMYGIFKLQYLRYLVISFNTISTIEGLKELIHLTYLNLQGNCIKTIENLNNNIKLEYINLSDNHIAAISDICFLKSLKELHLHGNRISHLKQCDKYLPTSLETLILSKNVIADLNEICSLANLSHLQNISINENPCVFFAGAAEGFDHRPFVLNWCMSVKVIDGFYVDPIESLKAEWLFSQGRGRQFRVGEQAALSKYLSSVCPLVGKTLENESDRKLRLILSKAQQHQRQLQEENSESTSTSGGNSPCTGRKKTNKNLSPKYTRLGIKDSSGVMSNSYHGNTSTNQMFSSQSDIHSNQSHILQMTTSLIENIKTETNSMHCTENTLSNNNTSLAARQMDVLYGDSSLKSNVFNQFSAASKMVPVPESLMSPDCGPASVTESVLGSKHSSKLAKNKDFQKVNCKSNLFCKEKNSSLKNEKGSLNQIKRNAKNTSNEDQELKENTLQLLSLDGSINLSSDDDSDQINIEKLKKIRNTAAQRFQGGNSVQKNYEEEVIGKLAILIQKTWRGYKSRKESRLFTDEVLKKRTSEYIEKLTKDMEQTKLQLENEKKIQQLQMQAINVLWKKISAMQTVTEKIITSENLTNSNSQIICLDYNTTAVVSDLTKTCVSLGNQVQKLQASIKDILNCMTLFCNIPQEELKNTLNEKYSTSTQTDIIAVNSPLLENSFFLAKLDHHLLKYKLIRRRI